MTLPSDCREDFELIKAHVPTMHHYFQGGETDLTSPKDQKINEYLPQYDMAWLCSVYIAFKTPLPMWGTHTGQVSH